MRRTCFLLAVGAVLFAATLVSTLTIRDAQACYGIIVGRAASANGAVLVGHAEQNGGKRILNFRRIPSRKFSEGATVTLRRGGTLPQVEQTAAFFWSDNPPQEYSDTYCNEHGVAIASDACSTREDGYEALVERGDIREGGIGYMLRRLVIERAKTARAGVRVAGELIEQFGYVHSGRTYMVADANEAWLLAVVRGRHWVAQRVPDDMVVILPNIHIIGEVNLDDTANFLASADLIDYAAKRGWYDPKAGKPFNFRKAYRAGGDNPSPRRHEGRSLVLGHKEPWPSEPPPIGMKPKEKMTVASVAAILRHTAGQGRSISTTTTQEGAVFELRANMPPAIGCIYWRTNAEPSTSVFLPFYMGITETPASFYLPVGVEKQLALDHHFEPPRGTFDERPDMAWWTFKKLQDTVRADYARRVRVVTPFWREFEQDLFAAQGDLETKAMKLWETDRDACRELLTQYCALAAARATDEAASLTKRLGNRRRR